MPQLKPGNEKKPSPSTLVPISYIPPNSIQHLVADGENWQSLAARYGMPALDIIKMNFKTADPYEINWYLREYVNCNTPTADGYNWRFSTSARNGPSLRAGKIFVNPNWTTILRAAKEATRDSVADWFQQMTIRDAKVLGPSLEIPERSVRSVFSSRSQFTMRLRNGGAPDQIAEKWAAFLEMVLRSYTEKIELTVPAAFPAYKNWNGPGVPPALTTLPFFLLQNMSGNGFVSRGFLRTQLQHYLGSWRDPAATVMANAYAVWFAKGFEEVRILARVMQLLGTVQKRPGEMVTGSAHSVPGAIVIPRMFV